MNGNSLITICSSAIPIYRRAALTTGGINIVKYFICRCSLYSSAHSPHLPVILTGISCNSNGFTFQSTAIMATEPSGGITDITVQNYYSIIKTSIFVVSPFNRSIQRLCIGCSKRISRTVCTGAYYNTRSPTTFTRIKNTVSCCNSNIIPIHPCCSYKSITARKS